VCAYFIHGGTNLGGASKQFAHFCFHWHPSDVAAWRLNWTPVITCYNTLLLSLQFILRLCRFEIKIDKTFFSFSLSFCLSASTDILGVDLILVHHLLMHYVFNQC